MKALESCLAENLSSSTSYFSIITDLQNIQADVCFAKFAPPESQWYHGQLDRSKAEARLRNSGEWGSYLVRRNEHKYTSYVLSYYGPKGFQHFDIEVVFGDFYFSGEKFATLNDLIGYYTRFCNIHGSDHLRAAVAPPERVNDKQRVVATLPYTRKALSDELSFRRGDILTVHSDLGDDILWATEFRSGKQGLIFRGFVEPLDGCIDPNVVHPWFHPDCYFTMPQCHRFIESGPESFLVGPSQENPDNYSIYVWIDYKLREVPIMYKHAAYLIDDCEGQFVGIDRLIEHYRLTKSKQMEGRSLKQPILRYGQPHLKSRRLVLQPEANRLHAAMSVSFDKFTQKMLMNILYSGQLAMRCTLEASQDWVECSFRLVSEGTRSWLCYNEKIYVMRFKARIDLSHASLYECHPSLWNRSHCFVIDENLAGKRRQIYLCAGDEKIYEQWITVLRPLCTLQCRNAKRVNVPLWLRQGVHLNMRVIAAMQIPAARPEQRIYCNISFDHAMVAKTHSMMAVGLIWNKEFDFE
ncbi:hypothetical protein KR222_010878 [Zaprionus bogoriensis]|nr:hypothetical protein KR222_010878 [Zaprionus bogoriensis]